MPPTVRIPRPAPDEHTPAHAAYLAEIEGDDAIEALGRQAADVERRFASVAEPRALHRYAPAKWSVKEVVGHLADTERILAYRALRFARTDATPLPGFDEDLYVPAGRFDARPMPDLLDEWRTVRAATITLLRPLDADAQLRRGVANGSEISVRAIAWVIAGHAAHHLGVLRERYGIR